MLIKKYKYKLQILINELRIIEKTNDCQERTQTKKVEIKKNRKKVKNKKEKGFEKELTIYSLSKELVDR